VTSFDDLAPRLALPVIAAPMFLVSGPDLVIAACRAGVIGSFPTVNARTPEVLRDWLVAIDADLSGGTCPATGLPPAPVAANLIVHPSNHRLAADLDVLGSHPPEIVITSVGSPAPVIDPLHDAGALVFADVATVHHARRAVEAGADGLVLLSAGSGGQTGWANPFAFVRAVRQFFDGTVVLAGGMSDGVAVRAAITLGADLAYLGTKFLATEESMAPAGHKEMATTASLDEVTLTSRITGLPTSMLRPSLAQAGLDIDTLNGDPAVPLAEMFEAGQPEKPRSWLDIWSAGHSVSGVHDVPTVAALIDRTIKEYWTGVAADH
jgi:nitronate monooxygenase